MRDHFKLGFACRFAPCFTYNTPQLGAADAEIKVPSVESLKVLPLKPGVGQYIAIHATLTATDVFLANFYSSGPFTYTFPKPLPSFSCVSCG